MKKKNKFLIKKIRNNKKKIQPSERKRRNKHGFRAVSYTHLDVYKRQPYRFRKTIRFKKIKTKNHGNCFKNFNHTCRHRTSLHPLYGNAVSYTHLDVYKRQLQDKVNNDGFVDYIDIYH